MGKKLKLTAVDYGNGIPADATKTPGAFFFPGTGPAGRCCRDCGHAMDPDGKNAPGDGAAKVRCGMVIDYHCGRISAAAQLRANTAACKYFARRGA